MVLLEERRDRHLARFLAPFTPFGTARLKEESPAVFPRFCLLTRILPF